MQLQTILPRGLAALRQTSRALLSTARPPTIRIARPLGLVAASAKDIEDDFGDVLEGVGSRRSLFNGRRSQPPAEGEGPATSRRDLVNLHKESLKDAGIELTPLEIERNRLHSVKQSLRRETRGAARAAVSREFKSAERRLYSTYRSRRDYEDGPGDDRPYRRRDREDEDDRPYRRRDREDEDDRPYRRRDREDEDDRPYSRRGRDEDAGRSSYDRRGRDEDAGRSSYDRRSRDEDAGRSSYDRRGREEDYGRSSYDRRGRGDEDRPPARASAASAQDDGWGDWDTRVGRVGSGDRRREEGERPAREKKVRVKDPKLMTPKGIKPKKKPPLTPQQIEESRQRAKNTALRAAAAIAVRRGAQNPGPVAAAGDDSDEDEMEEGEMGELFTVADQVNQLRGKAEASPLGDLDSLPKLKGVPKLTHNLPDDLNLRLLEKVMLGDKLSELPEIPLGASGLTRGMVVAVHLGWRNNEVVKLRIRDRRKTAKKYLPYINQVCEHLESMTGGVVVWRSGRSIWMYRGTDYKPQDPKDIVATHLNKREPPMEGQPLQLDAPLQGEMISVAPGLKGYLTRGSKGEAPTAAAPSDPPAAERSDVAVLFLHDAFGMDDRKRTHQVCDRLASMLGVPVLMPALLHANRAAWKGKTWPPEKAIHERNMGWMSTKAANATGAFSAVVEDLDRAVAYLRSPEVGASKLAVVGTGWGAWVAMHALAADVRGAAAALGLGDEAVMVPKIKKKKLLKKLKGGADSDEDEGKEEEVKEQEVVKEEVKEEVKQPAGQLSRGAAFKAGYGAPLAQQLARGEMTPEQAGLVFAAGGVASAGHFFVDEEMICRDAVAPSCFMSSKWDPMEKFQLNMHSPLVDGWAFKRFGKLKPGYFGHHADWVDPVQAKNATQALTLLGLFLRWHLLGDGAAEEVVRLHCMMGKAGVGEKQVYNLMFPWLEQVTLYKGHEKKAKREKEAEMRRQEEERRQEEGEQQQQQEPAWQAKEGRRGKGRPVAAGRRYR